MRAVIQRVTSSKVIVEGKTAGEISAGLNVLLCAMQGDDERHAQILARKIAQLRIFSDEQGKMNLSVTQINGAVLLISQFTLAADTRKGNRPGFTSAGVALLALVTPVHEASTRASRAARIIVGVWAVLLTAAAATVAALSAAKPAIAPLGVTLALLAIITIWPARWINRKACQRRATQPSQHPSARP